MNNKKKTLTASVAAIFCAATLALFGISGEKTIYVDYELTQSDTKAELSLTMPDEFDAGIAELLCNDMSVTKALLPDNSLVTIPFIFSDLNNLEIRFYRLGEVVGIGIFEDGRIKVAVKDNFKKLKTDEDDISDDGNAAEDVSDEETTDTEPGIDSDKINEEVRIDENNAENE